MKKIFFALALAACMLLSCGEISNEKIAAQQPIENDPPKSVEYIKVDRRLSKPVSGSVTRAYHLRYDGHMYIQFHCSGTHGGHETIVHDPDCPCHRSPDEKDTVLVLY